MRRHVVRTRQGKKPEPVGRPLDMARIGYGQTWFPIREGARGAMASRRCGHGVSIMECCAKCEDELATGARIR